LVGKFHLVMDPAGEDEAVAHNHFTRIALARSLRRLATGRSVRAAPAPFAIRREAPDMQELQKATSDVWDSIPYRS